MSQISAATRRGLVSHQEKSVRATRKELERARARILKKGTRLSVAAVCEEAGIERSTLYRFHEPILRRISEEKKKVEQARGQARHDAQAHMQAKQQDYRQLAEQAQSETAALARINYRLQARISELEEMLAGRDLVIQGIKERVKRVR